MRAWRQAIRICSPVVRHNHHGRKEAIDIQNSAGRRDPVGQFETHGQRILSIVQKRVQERQNLLAEVRRLSFAMFLRRGIVPIDSLNA